MMTQFSQSLGGSASAVPASELMRRKPQRLCTTVSWQTAQRLQERADIDGRSLSNLISYLLEAAL